MLAAASAMRPLVGLITFPILAALYSPSEFGVLVVVMSVVTLAGGSINLRYDVALVGARNADVEMLLGAGIFWSIAFGVGLALVGSVSSQFFVYEVWLTWPSLFMVGLAIIALGSGLSLQYFAIREQKFELLARTRAIQALVEPALQLLFAFASLGVAGLAGGYCLGLVLVCKGHRGDSLGYGCS